MPKEESGDESPTKTPKAKKRKKGESTFALTNMTVLADEPICDNVMALKAWRKLHFVGKHDIGPEEIKDPADAWKARDFNEDHTATLMKSFQEHQKMNAKGLRLVLQHQELWDAFEAMDEESKNIACELESEFYASMREQRSSNLLLATIAEGQHRCLSCNTSRTRSGRCFVV